MSISTELSDVPTYLPTGVLGELSDVSTYLPTYLRESTYLPTGVYLPTYGSLPTYLRESWPTYISNGMPAWATPKVVWPSGRPTSSRTMRHLYMPV